MSRHVHPLLAHVEAPADPTQQAILDELRRVLVSGAAPPGSSLPLDDLATAFGVSRIPVREALKTLTGEGLVEHEPRHGYTVARITRADFSELYLVRGALEGVALAAAAPRATPEQHTHARAVHAELDRALDTGRTAAFHRGSRAFHLALVGPSGMRLLLHLIGSTWNITEPAQPMTLLPEPLLHAMHEDHASMLAAWCAGDVPLLVALSERHTATLRSAVESLPSDHDAFAFTRP